MLVCCSDTLACPAPGISVLKPPIAPLKVGDSVTNTTVTPASGLVVVSATSEDDVAILVANPSAELEEAANVTEDVNS